MLLQGDGEGQATGRSLAAGRPTPQGAAGPFQLGSYCCSCPLDSNCLGRAARCWCKQRLSGLQTAASATQAAQLTDPGVTCGLPCRRTERCCHHCPLAELSPLLMPTLTGLPHALPVCAAHLALLERPGSLVRACLVGASSALHSPTCRPPAREHPW